MNEEETTPETIIRMHIDSLSSNPDNRAIALSSLLKLYQDCMFLYFFDNILSDQHTFLIINHIYLILCYNIDYLILFWKFSKQVKGTQKF